MTAAIYSDSGVELSEPKEYELVNLDAINQVIYNILNTDKQSRIFRPEWYGELTQFLFEPIDDITSLAIYRTLLASLEEHDPRISIDRAKTIVVPYPDEYRYDIKIVFQVKGLSNEKFEYRGDFNVQGS